MIRIGSGAGFSDDRIDPAVELAQRGRLNYLVFECLAERTLALAQLEKQRDPAAGFDPWLAERIGAVIDICVDRDIKIVTNMGAANPVAAAEAVAAIAARHGHAGLRIAAVTGDDVLQHMAGGGVVPADGRSVVPALDDVVSANAYLGCEGIVEALTVGAQVVVTGRVSDPSLYVGPLVHELGWPTDDWELMGRAICVGHMLECGGQVTGGYFADPGRKDVPDLARLGFPLAEVASDGSFVVTKVEATGGQVSVRTCTEQLLYELHDPAAYVSADAVADFSRVTLKQVDDDVVAVGGASGRVRPDALKVSVGYRDGHVGEGEISYAGPHAVARGRLALDVVRERLELLEVPLDESRFELIGVDAVFRGGEHEGAVEPREVRVRVAGQARTREAAERVGREVTALWLNGPAGGGGARRSVREQIAITSALIPRDLVRAHVAMVVAG